MMPPKATEKKLVAKKAAAFVQKDIDSTKYIRKVIRVERAYLSSNFLIH